MKVTIAQLRILLAVVRTGSIGAAARQLGLTQSGTSQAIIALESSWDRTGGAYTRRRVADRICAFDAGGRSDRLGCGPQDHRSRSRGSDSSGRLASGSKRAEHRLRFAPASQAAALIPGPMSVMAAILGLILLGERLRVRGWLGAALILVGSLIIAGFSGAPHASFGHAAFLLAALLWAGYVIVLRRTRLPALQATAIVAVVSAVLFLPVYIALLPIGLARAPLADIAVQAVYQGGLTTVIGLVAFNRAVILLGAAAGAALPALVPVVTLILAALLMNETPTSFDIAAAGLIGVGVLLVTSARNPPRAPHLTCLAPERPGVFPDEAREVLRRFVRHLSHEIVGPSDDAPGTESPGENRDVLAKLRVVADGGLHTG